MKIELVSANDKAYEVLLDQILSGERKSGDRLTIEKLSAELGISSTPIRDALKRLESEGIVRVVPRSGTFVSLPSEKDVTDLFKFRIAIERFAVMEALPRIGAKQSEAMRGSIQRARTAQQDKVFVEADREFHGVIIECADNAYLTHTADRIDRQLRFFRAMCATDHSFDNKVLEDHLKIVQAIETADDAEVVRLLEEHIRYVLAETLRLWSRDQDQ